MPDEFGAASLGISSSSIGSTLRGILNADDLQPGDEPSYQICKSVYVGHPLGAKMAETPIRLAQSQERDIEVPDSPEDEIVEAFQKQWAELEASDHILNVATQARIYGVTSVASIEYGNKDPSQPIDLDNFWKEELTFNTFDPLNTAGSLVTSQDPNSPLFQKWGELVVNGTTYHRSRTCTLLNERSLYIAWTSSAYGYVGRSVYQRPFYPLKSFLWTMITDEMVARKAGLIVARLEQPGSIVDKIWATMAGVKRALLKQARTDNVISVGKDEILETLNMRNVPESMRMAREDIIKNIATAADMPAKMLTQESFVEGFGEGTQDAYAVAQYVDRMRIELNRIYRWFDVICQYRAWNPEFYETIQRRFPNEYGEVEYKTALARWRNSFKATWPSLIKEKPSEAVDVEDVKLKALIAVVQVFEPLLDPDNKARLIQWCNDQFNTNENLFGGAKLMLDFESLADHMTEQADQQKQMQQGPPGGPGGGGAEGEGKPPQPFSAQDAARKVADVSMWLGDSHPLRRLAIVGTK